MNAETYCEWLRRQGLTVVRTASSWWHSQVRGVFQAFPYHEVIEPADSELRGLLVENRAVATRYSLPPGSKGAASYHVVYTAAGYGLDVLSARPRKNVRRALRECDIAPMGLERYIRESWPLRVDTLARQNRQVIESKYEWQRRFEVASDLPGFEAWGARIGGNLAASLVVFRMDGWCYVVAQQSHRDYLRVAVNNALTFCLTEDLVRRPGFTGIFYGMQSLDAPASVDDFKVHLGYERRPVRQRVVFHPHLAPFINRASYRLVKAAAHFAREQSWIAKAEGMFRVYLADSRMGKPNPKFSHRAAVEPR